VTIVLTVDQVWITAGLRVWVLPRAEPGLHVWTLPHEPGTVDLTTARTPAGRDPLVRVDLDSGRSVIVTAAMLAACHPRTGQRPLAWVSASGSAPVPSPRCGWCPIR